MDTATLFEVGSPPTVLLSRKAGNPPPRAKTSVYNLGRDGPEDKHIEKSEQGRETQNRLLGVRLRKSREKSFSVCSDLN
jgi:hypothetical protein